MMSATDVADADAESLTSDDLLLLADAAAIPAGDRARAKFAAILEEEAS